MIRCRCRRHFVLSSEFRQRLTACTPPAKSTECQLVLIHSIIYHHFCFKLVLIHSIIYLHFCFQLVLIHSLIYHHFCFPGNPVLASFPSVLLRHLLWKRTFVNKWNFYDFPLSLRCVLYNWAYYTRSLRYCNNNHKQQLQSVVELKKGSRGKGAESAETSTPYITIHGGPRLQWETPPRVIWALTTITSWDF